MKIKFIMILKFIKMVEELWKQVEIDGEFLNYELSSHGHIRNLTTKKLLSINNRKDGYSYYKFNTKNVVKNVIVHRLVANLFMDKPSDLECTYIDHKNGDKHDNRVENLEWVSHSENVKRAHQDVNRVSTGKMVEQWNYETNEFVKTFNSITEAANELGLLAKNFAANLSGRTKYINSSTGKFYFKYVEPKVLMNNDELKEFEPLKECPNYLIHCDGRIYNVNRKIFMKPRLDKGYATIRLNDKNIRIHRLVATQFISNPENKEYVNHKDGNKLNNNVDNLEWVTRSENVLHAYNSGLNPTTSVHQYSLDGKYIKTFSSVANAGKEVGLTQSQLSDITRCCSKKSKYAHGYIWRLASECDTSDIEAVILANNKNKPVEKLDKDTGECLQTFPGLRDAAESLGLERKNFSYISKCCKGETNNAHGYKWRFV